MPLADFPKGELAVTKFNAIIIGSGQAGNPLSHDMADAGWKVAMIERDHVGGTCVNTGCTPTKTMIASAQVAHYARDGAKWGIHANGTRVDIAEVLARKDRNVKDWRASLESKFKERAEHISLYRGKGRFIGPRKIDVNGQELESDRIFINTGTRSAIPMIEGLDQVGYLTNASIMDLLQIPEHLLILGAGYIGLEFGQMYRRFGSDVTVIDHGSKILHQEDADVSDSLRKSLEAEGIRFILGARARRAKESYGEVMLDIEIGERGDTVCGSHLLVAIGRRPNTDDLGIEKAGIETDSRGYIRTNARLETNVPGVWALGDVKGGPAFTHISFNDYQIVAGNLIRHTNLSIEHRIVPYAVYTDPELGRIGITEREARALRRRLKIGKIPMERVGRAVERNEAAGLMKIVVDAESDEILGAAFLSTDGGELVQVLMPVMAAGLPYTVLKGAIYIHPTLAEGLWALMEEVRLAE